MRRVRYSVAVSLDGYIAGPAGEFDWIIMDPAVDFPAFFREFDTVVMGRHTFDVAERQGPGANLPGMKTFVISRTLCQEDCTHVTISADACETVAALRAADGKDIWLFGGGKLFQTLLQAGLVDAIELKIMPVLLGEGIPFLPPTSMRSELRLTRHEALPSGIVLLRYDVQKRPD